MPSIVLNGENITIEYYNTYKGESIKWVIIINTRPLHDSIDIYDHTTNSRLLTPYDLLKMVNMAV